jgi:adenine-specific DNA methylase
MMTEIFQECHRILRDDGVLTVMFTHKQQSAWAALFDSLIKAAFTITATWPVQTESQHSLHQAKKNAAQSTVLLVARKRAPGAGRAYFDELMKTEIREVAKQTAIRLQAEGLNAIDQLVGTFGPAMQVFSRYSEVRTDTGQPVNVDEAILAAANAVVWWRIERLARQSLEGVDAESRFVLLCWDVLSAAEFRFNEAMLLGRAVGMDVARLKHTGLISTSGDRVRLISARERRRGEPIRSEQEHLQLTMFEQPRRGRKKVIRKVHPNDDYFASAIDMCHALALRCQEAGGGQAGIGAARGVALQQGWKADSACARLMVALVNAAPLAVRFPGKGKQKTIADEFPEFRAWHAMLKPLFGIDPPEWVEPEPLQPHLPLLDDEELAEDTDDEEAEER